MNDVSTLIKIPEYMALGAPIVSFDLKESRVSAQDAARYAADDDAESFAAEIDRLLDDRDARERMATIGRRRVESELAWKYSEQVLLAAYDHVLARRKRRLRRGRN